MIRTSIVLPPALHQYLSVVAQNQGKPFSTLVRDVLSHFVQQQSQDQLTNVYHAMEKMRGLVKGPPTNGSQTIDETLYGEHGAWRGEPSAMGLWKVVPDSNQR